MSAPAPGPAPAAVAIRRALLSVSDKRGIVDLARALAARGVELLSTGGTHRALQEAGVAVREVSEMTGFPEMMDGRVKTLHPRVHGGILALRDSESHGEAMRAHGIEPIDLVCVNLYPFEATVARPKSTFAEAIEHIDVGGPSMIRSAAKNHRFVCVLTDPDDYGAFLKELATFGGEVSAATRLRLARKAFAQTARYDAAISRFLEARGTGAPEEIFPSSFTLIGSKVSDLRYGENPHQRGAFYRLPGAGEPSVATARIRNGKALSYNNLLDLDAALGLVREFEDRPAVVVVKHGNPCGAAVRAELRAAAEAAWSGDPVSAFGSVIAANRPIDLATADFLADEGHFVECVIAPSFDLRALELLTTRPKWGKSVRLLETGPFTDRDPRDLVVRKVTGGFLLQDRDLAPGGGTERRVATKRAPTAAEMEQLLWAATVCKHVHSNAIVLAQDHTLVGTGAGQMSRVDSVRLAIEKAGAARVRGAVLASDAFFPFPDGVETAIEAGVTAVIQPGGSVRDPEVIAAADRAGIAMVMTGTRHFLH